MTGWIASAWTCSPARRRGMAASYPLPVASSGSRTRRLTIIKQSKRYTRSLLYLRLTASSTPLQAMGAQTDRVCGEQGYEPYHSQTRTRYTISRTTTTTAAWYQQRSTTVSIRSPSLFVASMSSDRKRASRWLDIHQPSLIDCFLCLLCGAKASTRCSEPCEQLGSSMVATESLPMDTKIGSSAKQQS